MLLLKIMSILYLSIFIFILLDFFKLFSYLMFIYALIVIFLTMAFHTEIVKFLIKIRDTMFRLINPLTPYEKKFREYNGIEGFKDIQEKHIALIHPQNDRRIFPCVYSKEQRMLYDHYNKNKEKYEIYFCYLCEQFVNLVKSKYITGFHIFGHGQVSHLTFEDGVVMYREFEGLIPKKDFVCQWHCNIGKYRDKHLGHIAKKYYVEGGYRTFLTNRRDIKKLIEGTLNWTLNPNL